ncbi:hypothetical protein SE92_30040 [Bradyrhizobium sp. AT1]|uniref:hypothetical protein n=1 Tax=Bradyrhizobium sp. AT1 TaxID=574934 RepID=UPI000799F91B|nr:hypothetical protein [Bradyrhizobium sp. AT1]KYG23961.1 hypothetical protein SE92_30040 [Bradyrhizobium sp. AT1]
MPSETANAAGEALLLRLRRLLARAGAVKSADRRQLLALLDDLETTRGDLLRECAEIEAQMKQATARTNAIGAYLRNSQVARGKPHH